MPCKMRFLDLCAGIGGFSLGLEWAGMTCAGQVEINPFCNSVLEKHWPHVPRWKDLKDDRDYGQYPKVDLVCGGYPCQPFSYAGKRRGTDDDRHLWPYLFTVVRRLRPSWCLFENVAGHISMGLDQVLSDMEGAGYACRSLVVPACGVEAWHRRERVWIVAYSDGERELQPEWFQQKQRERVGDIHRPSSDTGGEGLQTPWAFQTGSNWWQTRGMLTAGDWWAVEPGVVRVVHGLPGRMDRISALGNAVVPYLVKDFGLAIIEANTHIMTT